MADFSSTKRNASKEDWFEQLQCIVELNGYNPNFIPDEWEHGYEEGKQVADWFYDNYEDEE